MSSSSACSRSATSAAICSSSARRSPAVVAATSFRLGATLGEPREVERRDRSLQPRDLDPELLGPLGCGRLERERPQPLLDLVLEVARTLDLNRDARELQLGAVPAALEAAEPGRLLDQLAPLCRLRVEHRLDTALRDHRAQPAAEADVREQLDEVDAADRGLVDEVLALAAAVQAPRHRDLAVRQVRPGAVGVVEEQVDLGEVDGRRPVVDPAKSTSSGFSARSSPGLIDPVAQRIESETFDLPGAVRAHDDGDPGLELDLDGVDERLEAAQLDRPQVHAERRLASGTDAARASLPS